MNRRRTVQGVIALLLTFAALVGVAAPAEAGTPVLAHAHLDITWTTTTITVCADGLVADGNLVIGHWIFTIDGARSDGSLIQVSDGGTSSIFSMCKDITAVSGEGAALATLEFVSEGPLSAANTDACCTPATEVLGLAIDEVHWTPARSATLIIST
jgi:hypothetical protein